MREFVIISPRRKGQKPAPLPKIRTSFFRPLPPILRIWFRHAIARSLLLRGRCRRPINYLPTRLNHLYPGFVRPTSLGPLKFIPKEGRKRAVSREISPRDEEYPGNISRNGRSGNIGLGGDERATEGSRRRTVPNEKSYVFKNIKDNQEYRCNARINVNDQKKYPEC